MKETLLQAGYCYNKFLGNKQHLLRNMETGSNEIFFANKKHASWGIKWKNTHLEFMRNETPKIFKIPQRPPNG